MTDDIVEELRESFKKYGPIRNVIRTQFGIASGNTRKQAISDWPEVTMPVKDYYEHLQLMAADNVSEPKTPEWWTHVLSEAGKELEKQGVEPGRIVTRLLEDFPLSKSSIYRYLPSEFKRSDGYVTPQDTEFPAGDSIQQDDNKAITKPEPYRKGLSLFVQAQQPLAVHPAPPEALRPHQVHQGHQLPQRATLREGEPRRRGRVHQRAHPRGHPEIVPDGPHRLRPQAGGGGDGRGLVVGRSQARRVLREGRLPSPQV